MRRILNLFYTIMAIFIAFAFAGMVLSIIVVMSIWVIDAVLGPLAKFAEWISFFSKCFCVCLLLDVAFYLIYDLVENLHKVIIQTRDA